MHQTMLAIDAGNSRLKFGLFVPSRSTFYRQSGKGISKVAEVPDDFPSCLQFIAIPAGDKTPWKALSDWRPDRAVIAGSNQNAVERVLSEWLQSGLPAPIVIRDRTEIDVKLDVEFPERVGLDRLLNSVAANAMRPSSRPVIVIDSGTATTINCLNREGVFRGGAILPGLEMSAKALHHYTESLAEIPVQEMGGELPVVPGRNTRDAIRAGLFWGQVGAIRELVRQACQQQKLSLPDFSGERDDPNSPWMILTGGGGPVLSSQFPGLLFLPSLGMHGMVLAAWRQESGGSRPPLA
jgi:type III pantothenate kinase